MKYVKLIDYLDKPELIQHVDGMGVVGIEYDSTENAENQMKVTFDDDYDYYYTDGRYNNWDVHSWFVLKGPLRQFEQYEHHGHKVWVNKDLKGKHRDHCLCYSCENLDTENPDNNCPIAKDLFKKCLEHKVVIPVFECPKFKEMLSDGKKEAQGNI